jgi:hypothetical protein
MADWENILVGVLHRVKISYCEKVVVDVLESDLAGCFVA